MNSIKIQSLLVEIAAKKQEIDALRPLNKEQEGRIMQKFHLDWNYHSNAIEGNSLSYGETVALLMHGITAKGKPLKDHLDIRGHNEAIHFLERILHDDRPLSEADIRELHKLLLVEPYKVKGISLDGNETTKTIQLGKYKTLPNDVKTATGEIHYYAKPEEVPVKMAELIAWYLAVSEDIVKNNPVFIAALFHYRFVAIHPFDDGNGRTARLLMNLILMRYGYPPAIIKQEKESRNAYYSALSQADSGEYEAFIELVAEKLLHSLDIQLRGAKGENISELGDIRKEFFLLEKSLTTKNDAFLARTLELQANAIDELDKIFNMLKQELKQTENLFSTVIINIHYFDENNAGIIGKTTEEIKKMVIGKILFYVNFNNFNKSTKIFSINEGLQILFSDDFYQIKLVNTVLLTKKYNEKITEQEGVCTEFMKKILSDIQQQIK